MTMLWILSFIVGAEAALIALCLVRIRDLKRESFDWKFKYWLIRHNVREALDKPGS